MSMDSSDFLTFLSNRSSVREYRAEPTERKDISYILSCARTAPSAGNREAWDVVIVTDPTIRESLSDGAYNQEHVSRAPTVLVVCANYIRSMSQYGERGILYAIQDATIAATYMMLAAHALGLHTCWTGAFEEDEIRQLLSLPQHIRPVALLTVGSGHLPHHRTSRMPVDEHIHYDNW